MQIIHGLVFYKVDVQLSLQHREREWDWCVRVDFRFMNFTTIQFSFLFIFFRFGLFACFFSRFIISIYNFFPIFFNYFAIFSILFFLPTTFNPIQTGGWLFEPPHRQNRDNSYTERPMTFKFSDFS